MQVVLQLIVTATVYGLISWAIFEHSADSPFATSLETRRPWFSYGLLVASGGMLLIVTEMALSGWSEEPNPLTGTICILTILGGGGLTLFGFLDKYLLRRQLAEIQSRRARLLTQVFVAGFILLPLTAIFSCTSENPQNSSRSTSAIEAVRRPSSSSGAVSRLSPSTTAYAHL